MRQPFLRSGIIAAVIAFLFSTSTLEGQRGPRLATERVNGQDAVAGEVLVKFRRPLRAEEMQQLGRQHDLDRAEPAGRAGVTRVRSRSRSAADLLKRLSAHPDVKYAEPNYIVRAVAQPAD